MIVTDILGWVGSGLNLLGAYKVTQRNRVGYLIFAGSCCLQLPGLLISHVWSQAALLGAYIIIDLLGWWRWRIPPVVKTPLPNCYIDCVD